MNSIYWNPYVYNIYWNPYLYNSYWNPYYIRANNTTYINRVNYTNSNRNNSNRISSELNRSSQINVKSGSSIYEKSTPNKVVNNYNRNTY